MFKVVQSLLYFDVFQCHIPDGGVVPKSLYMKDDDADKSPDEPTFATDSIYQTTHVVKDYPHEVILIYFFKDCFKFFLLFYLKSSDDLY